VRQHLRSRLRRFNLVGSVDDTIAVETSRTHFPTRETVEVLRQCDIVIACVDKLNVVRRKSHRCTSIEVAATR
jgi:nucleoside 2-deoxyribosyltransferase